MKRYTIKRDSQQYDLKDGLGLGDNLILDLVQQLGRVEDMVESMTFTYTMNFEIDPQKADSVTDFMRLIDHVRGQLDTNELYHHEALRSILMKYALFKAEWNRSDPDPAAADKLDQQAESLQP